MFISETQGNNFRLGLSVAVIAIAVQTKHAGILETMIENCFKYCAPKPCKVAL